MVRQNDDAPKVVAAGPTEIDVITMSVATTQEKPNTPISLCMAGCAPSPVLALVLIADNKEIRENRRFPLRPSSMLTKEEIAYLLS